MTGNWSVATKCCYPSSWCRNLVSVLVWLLYNKQKCGLGEARSQYKNTPLFRISTRVYFHSARHWHCQSTPSPTSICDLIYGIFKIVHEMQKLYDVRFTKILVRLTLSKHSTLHTESSRGNILTPDSCKTVISSSGVNHRPSRCVSSCL